MQIRSISSPTYEQPGRPKGIEKQQVTVHLPVKVKRVLDAYCDQKNQSKSHIVTDLLVNFLSKQDIKPMPKKKPELLEKIEKLPDV